MTSSKGVLTTRSYAFPTGIDANILARWRIGTDGRSYDQIRSDVVAAFEGVNAELMQKLGSLVYITNDDHVFYPNGGAVTDFPKISDLDRVETYTGDTVGHMLPINLRGRGIATTEQALRSLNEGQMMATITDIVQSGRQTVVKETLTRLFTDDEILVGTSGYYVGMVSGSASVTYTPPTYEGKEFQSSHDHYNGYDSGSGQTWTTMLNALALHVVEHGHMGQLIALVSETDVAAIVTQLTTDEVFAQPTPVQITTISGSAIPLITDRQVDQSPMELGRFFGYMNSTYGLMELRATGRVPTGYAAVYVSAGNNVPDNPLYIRVYPDVGWGFYIQEVPNFNTTYPIKHIDVLIQYGVGAGRNRTRAAVGYLVAGGVWVDPSIS
jgi:hypothetical protein